MIKFYYRKLINNYSKYPIIYNNGFDFQKTLQHFKINCVLDVGAYTGTYAQSLRRFGYYNKIISFEPLSKSHQKLLYNSQSDENWIIHKKIALGAKEKKSKIFISKKMDSSSILKIKKNHLTVEPSAKIIGQENIDIKKLDDVINQYSKINLKRSLLKIDTQGYEYEVLKGAEEILKKIKLIQLELSLVELYSKQKSNKKILQFLKKNNFSIWNIIPGFKNKKNSRLLQYDMILFKTKKDINKNNFRSKK